MSVPTTILLDAIPAVRAALLAALGSLASGRVYWMQSPTGAALPLIVVQSQDAGGQQTPSVGAIGWDGLITVRCIAASLADAEALARLVVAALPAQTTATADGHTYSLNLALERPIVGPPGAQAWTAALVYRAGLTS